MRIAETILPELDYEGASTVRMLERVPDDRLQWQPHVKSMTLRELAWHLAVIPRRAGAILRAGEFDMRGARPDPASQSAGEIVAEFRRNLEAIRAQIDAFDDVAMRERVTLRRGDEVVLTLPKVGVIRSILLNHSYHHRGQLSVYLRMLDVPVPAIYGTSADEPG